MARGLPDNPPEGLEFDESPNDESCPACHCDVTEAMQDPMEAYSKGILLAIEVADGSVFSAMGGAESECWYFRCPNCEELFTLEAESLLGGMS